MPDFYDESAQEPQDAAPEAEETHEEAPEEIVAPEPDPEVPADVLVTAEKPTHVEIPGFPDIDVDEAGVHVTPAHAVALDQCVPSVEVAD